MKHVVGFSGGIDSQACALWVRNRYPREDVILLNSDAGGNEHPLTIEFIAEYSAKVHPVIHTHAQVQDMGGRNPGKIADLGLKPDDPLTFDLLAVIKGRFPSSKAQFCTEHLKTAPQRRWMLATQALRVVWLAVGVGELMHGSDPVLVIAAYGFPAAVTVGAMRAMETRRGVTLNTFLADQDRADAEKHTP